ncbi:type III restriction-modification system endonuclease [Bathymodiolus septemdierum thioautotrophic gill symbiont]|uniref:Type III restriction-modification system endonuclease n=1 Tax=endosymbiont of Bathymodiolus septemdierum str. Myojin knoll TaxID=1303921 RepID=A0A0P0URB8_9GAMM|nr:type III restriction-modification system endonuclease [Bathymodiolus septemdierum thioautotrophic gill symbiont]BAS67568.1 type III restriction-modification system endonuclease [endosymbiont of Bathymodiolus septemdierum str. Myojin knoll]
MAGFNFERDLPHQQNAVNSVLSVFNGAFANPLQDKAQASISNPIIKFNDLNRRTRNIAQLQKDHNINTEYSDKDSNILDISMETGTGKTYTYTKMIFELNKNLKLSKFIIVVPTLSIKAGTVNFLNAKATKEHFKQDYKKVLKTYIVESKKTNKNKKATMPQAVREFVEARDNTSIHILVINGGMINSDTMAKTFDVSLFDKYSSPFEAIQSIKPITIVDEPHKFATQNKTWENIKKLQSQYIFRYGATFNEQYENLLYQLTAVQSFNQNLVKGVVAYVEEFIEGEKCFVTLKKTDGTEAEFELNTNGIETTHKLLKNGSLALIHSEMSGLTIEKLNKTIVLLSNGLELKKGNKINPYSYAQSMQEKMLKQTISKHFEIEKDLLTREARIKPLTLFFIDDIESFRNKDGQLRVFFETTVKAHIKKLLKTETDDFYKDYLQKSLNDLSLVSGGYFSKDNTDKDDKIQKEVNEILHDKESLLSLDNPRRFIFSKWTLREGWDNPNVFQICKLRSSGSTTSKLQEVGRGLRLPVNEYMARVKDENFDLNYYVDFTESDFVDNLVNEINEKSNNDWKEDAPKLTQLMIDDIKNTYGVDENELLERLDELDAIKRSNDFKDGGYRKLQNLYPINNALDKGKVRNNNTTKSKTTIRKAKYQELKILWETINQKVVLEYKIDNEEQFLQLLTGYFKDNLKEFRLQGIALKTQKIAFNNAQAYYQDLDITKNELIPIVTMGYKEFLIALAGKININLNTIHSVFLGLKDKLNINDYMNEQTIRIIKNGFNKYLLDNAIDKFHIGYKRISNAIHPTKLTDNQGNVLKEINASDVGVFDGDDRVADNYLFDELFYDSNLEKGNILQNISNITVFTKIPKNSIKIPVVGGFSYSPDFAYVVKDIQGNQTLNLIVETKDKAKRDLSSDESQKIKHAEQFFNNIGNNVKVKFETQFSGNKILEIIQENINQSNLP